MATSIMNKTLLRKLTRAVVKLFGRTRAKKLVRQQQNYFQSLRTLHLEKLEANPIEHNQPYNMEALNQLLLNHQQRLILDKVGTNFHHQLMSIRQLVIHFHFQPKYQLPEELYGLTPTGKLSRKNMTDTFKNELLQDLLCSAVIRLAREAFALLPIEQVFIHVQQIKVNEGTGLYEQIYILSTKIERAWLDHIHLEQIDASEAIRHMPHRMDFKKTKGFMPIEKLSLNEEYKH